jgi:hypothetical protein
MKYALISDIHSNLPALEAVLGEAGSRNAFITPEPSLAGVTSSSDVLESESGSVGLA